jgi:hypothetical protein
MALVDQCRSGSISRYRLSFCQFEKQARKHRRFDSWIYVTVRSIAINQGMAVARLTIAFDRELARILELVGEDPKALREHRAATAEAQEMIFSARPIITAYFLASSVCFVSLYSSAPS